MSEWLCQSCWVHTETFHHFYERVLRVHEQKNYVRSNDGYSVVSGDMIKTELDENPTTVVNLVSVKLEEPSEPPPQTIENKHDSSSSDECNDIGDVVDSRLSTDDEDDNDPDYHKLSNDSDSEDDNTKRKPRPTTSRLKRAAKMEKEDAQIREIFSMKCNICDGVNVQFETWLDARRHYREEHNMSGYLVCCGNKFTTRYLIMEHVLRHINPTQHQCNQCDRICSNKFALKSHIDTAHAPLHSRTNKCSLCPSSFVTAGALRKHVQNKHSETGEQFPCDVCGKRLERCFHLSIFLPLHCHFTFSVIGHN